MIHRIWPVHRRPNVSWMTQADDRILETLAQGELVLSPKIIAYNCGYGRDYVSQRLRPLRENGLIERVDKGVYEISDLGMAYLQGELDAGDLEPGE